MWILPSRSRPHNMQRFIDAWKATAIDGNSQFVEVILDHDDPAQAEYMALDYPRSWRVVAIECVGSCGAAQSAYRRNRREPFYGLLGDDVMPRSVGWNVKLATAAGNDGVAFGDDTINGATHAAHSAIAGDLVREIGWLSLPGLKRLYLDTIWTDIGRSRGTLRYLPHVLLEHMHFSNGKAPFDTTYDKPSAVEDRAIYQAWFKEWTEKCRSRSVA